MFVRGRRPRRAIRAADPVVADERQRGVAADDTEGGVVPECIGRGDASRPKR
jgi:hypothetical protein